MYLAVAPFVWQRDADKSKAVSKIKRRIPSMVGSGSIFIYESNDPTIELDKMGNILVDEGKEYKFLEEIPFKKRGVK